MKNKYPVLKCTKELWEEIRPVLESFDVYKFDRIHDWCTCQYLISNYGNCTVDIFSIGNGPDTKVDIKDSLRYLVNTKEEFLSAVAKLLGKTYPNYDSDYDIDLIKSKERKYLGENDKIHCSTEEEAKKVIGIYYILGFHWALSSELETNHRYNREDTVYNVSGSNILYGNVHYAKAIHRNIISASEFINYYTSNNMEKRNIQIDKETARKWYNGNDNTLKELALQAYKEEELKVISYGEILRYVDIAITNYNTPTTQCSKWKALHKLAIIAKYLNKGWKPNWKDTSEDKYYIIKRDSDIVIDHLQISNYGVVVFNSYSSAKKAIEIMGDEINYIFD